MQGVLVLVSAVLGLAAGSFCNVLIWRVPRQESVVRPGSHCPACQAPIAVADNVPVLSWMVLGRQCRQCRVDIPIRYPLVELAGAGLFAGAAARFGWSWALPAYFVFFATLLAITVIDLEHYIIPNRILVPATAAALPLVALAAIGEGVPGAMVPALVGGVGAFVVLLTVNLVSPAGMGMGDVKISFLLGLHLGLLGLDEVVLGFFLAFVGGAVTGLALVALKLRSRKDAVPFGPFLAVGSVLAVLFGEPILRWYSGS